MVGLKKNNLLKGLCLNLNQKKIKILLGLHTKEISIIPTGLHQLLLDGLGPNGSEGLKRFSWVIPYYKMVIYKTPNYSIHSDGNFIRFSNDLNKKENIKFFKKIFDHKLLFNKQNKRI